MDPESDAPDTESGFSFPRGGYWGMHKLHWRLAAAVLAGFTAAGVAVVVPTRDGAHAKATKSIIDPSLLIGRRGDARVIVQKLDGRDGRPEREVRRLGGTVTKALPIVHGFAATLPADAVVHLGNVDGVRAITPDAKLHPMGLLGPSPSSSAKSAYLQEVRATSMWQGGVRGQGVTVALVDTGVANVPDLNGRVVTVRDDLNLLQPTSP